MKFRMAVVAAIALVHAQGLAGQAWQQYATPADAGFSAEHLSSVRVYADSVRSAAVMAVLDGRVVVAWGDVARKIPAHSVRKSFMSALYGISGIGLDATLREIGIEELGGLTAVETSARVRDIIAARSGVYLPAAYAAAEQDSARPARGSHPPGTHWFYNNWDFNVAGVIYERVTKTNLYEAFDRLIAKPIGMQDYTPADGFVVIEPGNSMHPAQTFNVSARDMARFGQLYLQNGLWHGRQVVPADWVRESTRAHTDIGDGQGYGYMWWTYAKGSLGAAYPNLDKHDVYIGRGTGGQAILVVPGANYVFVHRGDTENNRNVSGRHVWVIADRILAARTSTPRAQPVVVALNATAFASQLPQPTVPTFTNPDREQRQRVAGRYEIAPNTYVRVFEYQDRLFINVPGQGEAELFALTPLEYTIRVQAGVGIRFEYPADGSVGSVVLRLGPQEMRGTRR